MIVKASDAHVDVEAFDMEVTITRSATYLTLIDAVAFLHQYQRPRKAVEVDGQPIVFIEVGLDDIAVANRLAHEVLGRSIDELKPQTWKLLQWIDAMVGERGRRTGDRTLGISVHP